MKDQRPYLLRGLFDWIVDSGCTPYILVDAERAGPSVPSEQVQDGRIVLNIAPAAVRHLLLGEEMIEFECRFSGVPHHLEIPLGAVLAIYARENGAGMAFQLPDADADGEAPDDGPDDDGGPGGRPGGGPTLRVVK